MKIFLCAFLLTATSAFAAERSGPTKDSSGWAVMYGGSWLREGQKHAEDVDPVGTSIKGSFTQRSKYIDFGLMTRYASQSDDFTYQSVKGKMYNRDLTLGAQVGFWAFSWFQVHAGYAFHSINQGFNGDFTASQKDSINDQYNVFKRSVYGGYFGSDLVLLQSSRFQFFANYDYFYLNGLRSSTWDVMAGMRFYFDSANVGKGNFFVRLFSDLLTKGGK